MKSFKEENLLHYLLVMIVLYCVVFFFSTLYVLGDQTHYIKTYKLLGGLSIKDAYYIYNGNVLSFRFTHLIFDWIFSTLAINKNIIMSFLNVVLGLYSYVILRKMGATILVSLILIFTNYYFWITYLSLETFKIALIFFILSLYYKDNLIVNLLFSFLSIISHHSILIIYMGIWNVFIFENIIINKQIDKKNIFLILIFLTSVTFIGFVYQKFLIHKYNGYVNFNNILIYKNYLPVLLALLTSIYLSRKYITTLILYLPCIISVMLMGGTRVNHLVFLIFISFLLKLNNGKNILFYLVSLYLFYKTIIFLKYIYIYGNGFH